MLEIKNLTKIYKPKKADPVVALNNVSLTFNSTGLVFLLGKSGSGKSTLLNVLGGLDKFDSGEIIIDGKSSNTFKEKDFDAYRNTYLGFIFQEYNILPEFTVEKNIEFALELQGKKADKKAINDLLEQVDLKGYGKRKPNQLSGGQKQRIAIARALVKNPRIIMADEPTGALDSNTGKQVLDTLKKLSKEKLVIVVSHDREFAEIYGDRIIELKDGSVISDSTKRLRSPQDLSSGIQVLDESILHIQKNHQYTKQDVLKVFDFLKNAKSDVILTSDEKINKDVRKIAKIDEEGNREYFNNTTDLDIEKADKTQGLKLIKSRLKFFDSFKMGASGLKTKKIRLVITILLSAIALTLFGLADTMASFNIAKSNYDSLMNMNTKQVSIDLRHVTGSDNYYYGNQEQVGEQDLKDLKEKFPDYTFKPVHAEGRSGSALYSMISDSVTNNYYYVTGISGIASLTKNEMQGLHLSLYHEGNTLSQLPNADDEIMLTKYQYELIKHHGLKDIETSEKITIRSLSDLMGKTIKYLDKDYTIVGVLNGTIDEARYQKIKEMTTNYPPSNMYMLVEEYKTKLTEGFNNVFVFTENELNRILKENTKQDKVYGGDCSFTLENLADSDYYGYSSQRDYGFFGDALKENILFFNANQTTLGKNEVVIGYNVPFYLNNKSINLGLGWYQEYDLDLNKYIMRVSYKDKKYNSISELQNDFQSDYRLNYGSYTLPTITFYNDYKKLDMGSYKVVGLYLNFDYFTNIDRALIFKDVLSAPKGINYLANSYANITTGLLGNRTKDYALISYLSNYNSKEDVLVIRSSVSGILENFVDMINVMAKVFLYVGIGFAVFSALLLMNFIGISISYKKKEIGILRALGARGSDVYGIFLNESLIITFINFLVSIALTIGGVILINRLVVSNLGIKLTLLSFGLRQILLLLVVSLIVALVASFLPTHRVSKMKPIDAILDRKMK